MPEIKQPEPWLRGTLTDTPAVLRAVLHALQAAEEDLVSRCETLTNEEINARPSGLPSVAFHLKHIAGSLDRLLTYAEGRDLTDQQMLALKSEANPAPATDQLFLEFSAALKTSADRVRRIKPEELEQPRTVGRRRLPTTLAGLLVHVADHTQRHVGQAITTARIVQAKQ
ncbi:MAG TPA: DinB family protein [Terriglobales bacterium]